jgi:hypothetical protein
MPGFGPQGKFVCVYTAAKKNLRSVQGIFLRFWQTKGGRDVCRINAAEQLSVHIYNMSTKTSQAKENYEGNGMAKLVKET